MEHPSLKRARKRARRTVTLRVYMLLAVTLILLTDVFDRWSVPIADTDFAYYRTHFMSDVGRMASNLEIKPRPTRGLPLSRWVGR